VLINFAGGRVNCVWLHFHIVLPVLDKKLFARVSVDRRHRLDFARSFRFGGKNTIGILS